MENMKLPFAVFQLVDKQIVTLVVSDGFCDLLGLSDRARVYEAMDHDTYRNVHPEDVARVGNAVFCFMKDGGQFESVYRLKKKNGNGYLVIHAFGRHVYTETGERLAQIWYADEGDYAGGALGDTDLSIAMGNTIREENVLGASHYDYLTGLPSMTRFFELTEAGQKTILEKGGNPVLLYTDLSGMKFYNSKYGFAQGDKLLQSYAGILGRTFGSEHCCRIGADHFAALSEQEGLDRKLRQLLSEWQEINNKNLPPVHVGVYLGRGDDIHISFALDRAKMACSEIKDRYEMSVNYYSQDMSNDAEKKQYVIENIDRAIAENRIRIYFQPIIRAVNGKVSNVEALARWDDPVRGFLSPVDFIPALEEAGLIYKLDLYMVEQLLEKMKHQQEAGYHIVPHSINLSRSDFDVCDMVEESRQRVDDAGVSRDRIVIEITESTLGSNFDFIREQVGRFQNLGFPVWMDDFGSGYSSLDVLQSIKFDLLKFDMSFMRKLDEGENGKIILTELMRMATALGVDTLCEGVETEDQVRFLQESGCSKLQGYYYSKPIPLEKVVERYKSGIQTGFENPEEADYYEEIGRINLYDLSAVASNETNAFQNTFNTIPMGIIEVRDDEYRFVRSNRSYRNFMRRFFDFDLTWKGSEFQKNSASFIQNIVKTCRESAVPCLYDEKLTDGSVVHSIVRRISSNPVSGSMAFAVAVLSITEPGDGATYADIARALAGDYYNIYVVDLDTDRFIEYTSPVGTEELAVERHGEDFFTVARRDTMTRIYEEDREFFLAGFSKEKVIMELDRRGIYTATYRLIDTGTPMYANLKITRMGERDNRIIMGVSIIEAQMRQKEAREREKAQNAVFRRIAALSGKYYALYTIDPETGLYSVNSVTSEYSDLGYDREGDDFFQKARTDAEKYAYSKDLPMFLDQFHKENVMRDIKEKGMFQLRYRIMVNNEPKPIVLRVAKVEEDDGIKLAAGVTIIDEND